MAKGMGIKTSVKSGNFRPTKKGVSAYLAFGSAEVTSVTLLFEGGAAV